MKTLTEARCKLLIQRRYYTEGSILALLWLWKLKRKISKLIETVL